ncbi:hypothetical protein [Soonwooa sp.]|uniref:hypothetical protein n=1 Tax=Soonwooa sp. TaxID=1938592 RepID=UPI0026153E33|nr:hypothetical protein [Soonwooa sp.]
MMKFKNIFSALLFMPGVFYTQSKSVGINTNKPDASALLDISGDAPKAYADPNAKFGMLPPRIALKSNIDVATVNRPAVGLLVFNTSNAGTFPNEVSANEYYYWDGSKWEKLVYTSIVEDAVKLKIFYAESNVRQNFTSDQVNFKDGETIRNVVNFEAATINSNNFIKFDAAASTFTATISGIYDFSAFVNYNPMAATVSGPVNNRAFLNLIVQKKVVGSSNWDDSIGTRSAWGEDAASTLKTTMLLGTPLQLNAGDQVRLVIGNPFGHGANNDHCGTGDCYIGNDVAAHIPVAKGIRIQLLDYNIK